MFGSRVHNRWGEMNEEHGHRCSDKLFTSFFSVVLPAAFHWACHWTTKAGTGGEVSYQGKTEVGVMWTFQTKVLFSKGLCHCNYLWTSHQFLSELHLCCFVFIISKTKLKSSYILIVNIFFTKKKIKLFTQASSWNLIFHPLLIVTVFLNDQMQCSKWSKHKQIAIGSFQCTNHLQPIYTVITDNKAKIIHSEASSSPTKWIINSHENHNKYGQNNNRSAIFTIFQKEREKCRQESAFWICLGVSY